MLEKELDQWAVTIGGRRGRAISAERAVPAGGLVFWVGGEPTPYAKSSDIALQIGRDTCLDSEEELPCDYINHSCRPSLYVDPNDWSFRVARDLRAGDELTYDYDTTEWDVGDLSFKCFCGEKGYRSYIRGSKHSGAKMVWGSYK